jgi:hypothetical protein
MINKTIEENNPIKIKKFIFNKNENKWKDESISNFVEGVTLTLLIYEVIRTRYRLISRSNTLKCIYISNYYLRVTSITSFLNRGVCVKLVREENF